MYFIYFISNSISDILLIKKLILSEVRIDNDIKRSVNWKEQKVCGAPDKAKKDLNDHQLIHANY